MSTNFSYSIFVIFGALNALGAKDMSCIDVEPVHNVDAVGYSGNWFVIGMQNENDKNSACKRNYIFLRENDDVVPIVRMWKNITDNSTHMQLKNQKMAETGEGVSLDGYKLTLVGADYEKWLIFIACDESADKRLVWVSTRLQNPDFSQLFSAYGVLRNYNIDITDLRSINQKSCPDDWSDAEKDEVDFKYEDVKDDLKKNGIIKD